MLPITHSDKHCFAEFFIELEAFPASIKNPARGRKLVDGGVGAISWDELIGMR